MSSSATGPPAWSEDGDWLPLYLRDERDIRQRYRHLAIPGPQPCNAGLADTLARLRLAEAGGCHPPRRPRGVAPDQRVAPTLAGQLLVALGPRPDSDLLVTRRQLRKAVRRLRAELAEAVAGLVEGGGR